ncbi:hypothetical protein GLW03_14385 [Halobacillus halophilus]|uniref:hypothetical protein n=1 Tax=Halobacillus halophilus TaxID=1570 RepID=UPI00136B0D74|nr:hypothetical protein [Halobacillus halophilus]MYL31002.1 hypothetical protein [Halobacillus halophilus]
MKQSLHTLGSIILFVGVVLFILRLQSGIHLLCTPYLLCITGAGFLAFSAIAEKKEASLLCRVGLHKYEKIGWDDEIKSRTVYQCQRCGRKKKVFRAV